MTTRTDRRTAIAVDGTHFVRAGEPWVMVADTAWSAFADASRREWLQYVRARRAQGFNTVLISVLPILHDRATRADARDPFELDADGHYDFARPAAGYFEHAAWMVEAAAELEVTCALVVLWCNYVPGTWGAALTPWGVMTADQRNAHIDRVVAAFAEADPVFVISGDEAFAEPAQTEVYLDALKRVKRAAPWCLTTMHSTPSAVLPAQIADAPQLDFYAYQAGHDADRQDLTWLLAAQYLGAGVRRPIVDFEPCYEGHGYNAGRGRFVREDVRRAVWWGILGGAAAGVGYGAHGVWQWYRPEARFTNPGFSLEPFPVDAALRFPGADDAAFAAEFSRTHRLFDLVPRQDLLLSELPETFRVAASTDLSRIAVYAPDPRAIRLGVDVSRYNLTAWDLSGRRPVPLIVSAGDGGDTIAQPDFLSDAIVVLERRTGSA